ncbi:MAG: TrbI/VirB10 family protein [Pseudomonadota bacterium]
MTYLPPDPPLPQAAAPPPERKASSESVLAAPRTPVTRWNRKYLIAGTGVLALLVGAAFYIGFGGQQQKPAAPADPQANADTSAPQPPAISTRFSGGYGDPTVTAGPGQPGFASLPPANPPGLPTPTGAATPPPAPVAPQIQAARDQARAARAAPPFFGGAQAKGSASPAETADLGALSPPLADTPAAGPGEVQPGNGQLAKAQFAQASKVTDYLTNPLRPAISRYEVKAGALIPAALLTAVNSDLPGEAIAQVTEPVYDHVTGRVVLIPQGSRLIGQYDSQVAYGQSRVQIAWNRIIMPDGRSVNIGSMTGADRSGVAGLEDQVDTHFGQLARAALLSTLFSVGAASAQDAGSRSSDGVVLNSAGTGVSASAQQIGQQITGRDLNRQPTIRIRAGFPVRVIVNKDMILAPYP